MLHQMNDCRERELPSIFCWTRFGTEAGEPIERILERKDLERHANGNVFYWGVGNSVAPGITELIRQSNRPEVLFSPIRSRPRAVDARPASVLAWRVGETLRGERFELPPTVLVTSRGEASSALPHYALVCWSESPLVPGNFGQLSFAALRNLLSGKRVGASQVTAIVKNHGHQATGGLQYRVSLRTSLVPPFFVRLREPITMYENHFVA